MPSGPGWEAGGVSGRMSVYNDPAIKAKYKFVEPMVASWQKGVPEFRPRFPAWPAISEVVAEWGSKMMLGQVSVEAGSKEIGTRKALGARRRTILQGGFVNGFGNRHRRFGSGSFG